MSKIKIMHVVILETINILFLAVETSLHIKFSILINPRHYYCCANVWYFKKY